MIFIKYLKDKIIDMMNYFHISIELSRYFLKIDSRKHYLKSCINIFIVSLDNDYSVLDNQDVSVIKPQIS